MHLCPSRGSRNVPPLSPHIALTGRSFNVDGVFCKAGTGLLILFTLTLCFKGCAMAQAVSRWSLTAETRFRSQVSPCEICGGHSSIEKRFSPSSSGLHSQYHSTNTPYSCLFTCLSCQKDKRRKPGNLSERNSLPEIVNNVDMKVLPVFMLQRIKRTD